jgi:hypothetical protein
MRINVRRRRPTGNVKAQRLRKQKPTVHAVLRSIMAPVHRQRFGKFAPLYRSGQLG